MLVRSTWRPSATAERAGRGTGGRAGGLVAAGQRRDLLRTRLQAVSEPARQMLTAAAVLGSDNDAELLRP